MYDIRSEAVPLEGSLGTRRGPKPRRRRTPGASRVRALESVVADRGRAARARGQALATPSAVRTTPHAVALPFTGGLPSRIPLSAGPRGPHQRRAGGALDAVDPDPLARGRPAAPDRGAGVVELHRVRTPSWIRRSPRVAVREVVTSPGQVCAFAANSGDSGYGFWPGDGSDGMDGDYMASGWPPRERARCRVHLGRGGRDLQRQPSVDRRDVRVRLRHRCLRPSSRQAHRTR